MTEPTPPANGETPPAGEQTPPTTETEVFTADDRAKLQAALDKERTARKEYEKQVRDFDTQRKASMTEAERAVAEAEERGRAAVRTEYGTRLAQTEFRAAAAARNAGFDVNKALAYVDLGRFVGDDGEPNAKAIAAAVADLVPEATGATPPSFDGGTRTSPPAGQSMTDLIRQAAGRA